ncbi:hypothetical protein [Klebsiella quasipneumoniae]|uniref:hypothetical protein n=1 Tax=Klebsiella quasipneumoniae TaxID=1463165 RepID=UPI001D12F683|nr:hypothetical protein [Klebsiella quasipneumoniae]
MTIAVSRPAGLPAAVYALSVGSFGIGTTEFVIMGLLLDVAHDFHISITLAAWSITAYACGGGDWRAAAYAAIKPLSQKTGAVIFDDLIFHWKFRLRDRR